MSQCSCRRCGQQIQGDFTLVEEPGPMGGSFFICTNCWPAVMAVVNDQQVIRLRCHNCSEVHTLKPTMGVSYDHLVAYECHNGGGIRAYAVQDLRKLKDGTHVSPDDRWHHNPEEFA